MVMGRASIPNSTLRVIELKTRAAPSDFIDWIFAFQSGVE